MTNGTEPLASTRHLTTTIYVGPGSRDEYVSAASEALHREAANAGRVVVGDVSIVDGPVMFGFPTIQLHAETKVA